MPEVLYSRNVGTWDSGEMETSECRYVRTLERISSSPVSTLRADIL